MNSDGGLFIGSGKSSLINSVQKKLVAKGLQVCLTATTGLAATVISGVTVHRAIGLVSANAEECTLLATQNAAICERMR